MKLRELRNISRGAIVLYLVGAIVAVALKHYYSRAGSDDLPWILAPTAFFVHEMTGLSFVREAGAGFINYEHRIIIAPACAGVNFLIISFCTVFFSLARRLPSLSRKWLWLAVALASSYVATIAVNALRIVLAVFLIDKNVHYGWLTPERIHRLEGIVVYFLFLSLLFLVMKGALPLAGERNGNGPGSFPRPIPPALAPLCWYLLVTLAVPLLNGSAKAEDRGFTEHFWTVLSVCALLTLILFGVRLCSRRLFLKMGGTLVQSGLRKGRGRDRGTESADHRG